MHCICVAQGPGHRWMCCLTSDCVRPAKKHTLYTAQQQPTNRNQKKRKSSWVGNIINLANKNKLQTIRNSMANETCARFMFACNLKRFESVEGDPSWTSMRYKFLQNVYFVDLFCFKISLVRLMAGLFSGIFYMLFMDWVEWFYEISIDFSWTSALFVDRTAEVLKVL